MPPFIGFGVWCESTNFQLQLRFRVVLKFRVDNCRSSGISWNIVKFGNYKNLQQSCGNPTESWTHLSSNCGCLRTIWARCFFIPKLWLVVQIPCTMIHISSFLGYTAIAVKHHLALSVQEECPTPRHIPNKEFHKQIPASCMLGFGRAGWGCIKRL